MRPAEEFDEYTEMVDSNHNTHTNGSGLGPASQGHEMHCHDPDGMGSNPGSVELGLHSTAV